MNSFFPRQSAGSVIGILSVWKAMRLVSVFCLTGALFIGCGEPNLNDPRARDKVLAKAIDASNLQTRRAPSGEELRYAPNQERPYTGWVKSIGEVGTLAQFQNGKPNGIYISWYSNGQNSEKGIFRNGRNGLWTKWYKNGQKSSEGPYKNGERDGLWIEWYTDGTEKSKGTYKSGIKDGAWTEWYNSGQKCSERTYKDGEENGLWTEWYKTAQKRSERTYKDGMVLIPAGGFEMGSNRDDSDEEPTHTVYVDAFYMDASEVTNAAYKKFVDTNPQWQKGNIDQKFHNGYYLHLWNGNNYPSGKGDHPVVYVSWYAAMAYAKWAGKRLPTEAEWEKAARGGLIDKQYPWGDIIDRDKANYSGNVGDTTPARSYLPNAYGLYDMAGNVWEWCLDEYDSGFYRRSPRQNPIAGETSLNNIVDNYPNVNNHRVLRGGSWINSGHYVRCARRSRAAPTGMSNDFGFRCAKGSVTP